MTPDDILDEIENLPVGEVLSDSAAQFIQWYLSELDGSPKTDFEKLMEDHWFDYINSKENS